MTPFLPYGQYVDAIYIYDVSCESLISTEYVELVNGFFPENMHKYTARLHGGKI